MQLRTVTDDIKDCSHLEREEERERGGERKRRREKEEERERGGEREGGEREGGRGLKRDKDFKIKETMYMYT